MTLQEIRWHGRGGQGAWTVSELLAKAAMQEGKYVQAFPEFGPERTGAPIRSFTRISDQPINLHYTVYTPHVAVVLDPTLLEIVQIAEGLREDGILMVNTDEDPAKLRGQLKLTGRKVWTVPATDIAIKILGRFITNTACWGGCPRIGNGEFGKY